MKSISDLYFCPDGDVTSIVGRKDLPGEKKRALRSLHTLDKRWNAVVLLHYVLWISAAALSISSSNPIICVIGYMVSGLSMSSLSALSHESSHNLMTRNPRIDRWIGFICGWPILFSALGYRVMHPIHHKSLRTPADPDDIENVTKHPLLLRWVYVFVFFFSVYLYLIMVPANAIRRVRIAQRVAIAAEFVAMAGIVSLGWLFLPARWMIEGWLIPLLVAGQIANIRGVAEHGMTTSGSEMTNARTITSNRLLSFLMCNINYHIEHHLYPGIPWYNLPKVHALLEPELLAAGSSVYGSYWSFLADVARAVGHGVISNRRLIPEHIREQVCA